MSRGLRKEEGYTWPERAEKSHTDEKIAVLTLLRATNIGSRTVWKLVSFFGSAQTALQADDYTLETVGEMTPDTIRSLRDAAGSDFGEQQLELCREKGAEIILPNDEEYPGLLLQTHSPPAALFRMGLPVPKTDAAVAIVGSRRSTEAGEEVSHQIAAGLAKAGVLVISGMAQGIDAAAHRGCLQENGHTIAIFGCGVDVVYPRQNRKIYDEILVKGTMLSELFLGVGPEPRNFPMRNRIIAGMSLGTVVVEAAAKSGAIITANLALQENREVFAVPGHPLSRQQEGNNYLLRQGARFVRHAGDILEDLTPLLGLEDAYTKQGELPLDTIPDNLTADELKVFERLDTINKVHADLLSDKLKIDTSRLGAILLALEFKGVIQRLPGDHYRRKSPSSW
ncbi:DNA-processing protein DprA [bacterium]|nr:DNA-processing protein DprA [bacterium]